MSERGETAPVEDATGHAGNGEEIAEARTIRSGASGLDSFRPLTFLQEQPADPFTAANQRQRMREQVDAEILDRITTAMFTGKLDTLLVAQLRAVCQALGVDLRTGKGIR